MHSVLPWRLSRDRHHRDSASEDRTTHPEGQGEEPDVSHSSAESAR